MSKNLQKLPTKGCTCPPRGSLHILPPGSPVLGHRYREGPLCGRGIEAYPTVMVCDARDPGTRTLIMGTLRQPTMDDDE